MKRTAMLCLVGLLALAFGCGRKDKIILLKNVPEIDRTAMDPYADLGSAEISQDRMWVNISGTAKQELGQGLQVEVERFTAQGRLDNVTAHLTLANPPPPWSGPPVSEPGQEEEGPMYGAGQRPPLAPPIVVGDEVVMAVDATTNKGVITKLVLKPVGAPMPGR